MDRLEFLRTKIEKKELPTYVYGYPSKRSYRVLPQPLRITDVVEQASRSKQINIYIHIPFVATAAPIARSFLQRAIDRPPRGLTLLDWWSTSLDMESTSEIEKSSVSILAAAPQRC